MASWALLRPLREPRVQVAALLQPELEPGRPGGRRGPAAFPGGEDREHHGLCVQRLV